MMLAELRQLLEARAAGTSRAGYRAAIIDDNVLGKKTQATRRLTAQRLSELYALDPEVPLFRLLRRFWALESEGRPLLAFLCASARDPLLRLTAGAVLKTPQGETVGKADLEAAIGEGASGRFNAATQAKIARNAASSWTQAGFLTGYRVKRRSRPVATPANAAYALVLGYLAGVRGAMLFATFWARLLDLPTERVHTLAAEASRRGWLNYRHAGAVTEVRFPGLLTAAEQEMLRGEN
jgi:hypothetical protein